MNTETEHMIGTLKTLMRILGFRNSDIERKLGWSVSYLSRLYSGGIELRFEHIVDIARALEMRPQEIFRFAYPDVDEPPSDSARRVRQATASLSGRPLAAPQPQQPMVVQAPPPAGLSESEVERIVIRTMRRMLSEGSADDRDRDRDRGRR